MAHHEQLSAAAAVATVALANVGANAPFVIAGPEIAVVLGVKVELFSAAFAIGGVMLGQLLAPSTAPTLGAGRRVALFLALVGIALGIVIASGQMPLIALSWGIGLGFSGITIVQMLGAATLAGVKRISDVFIGAVVTRLGGKQGVEGDE